MYVFSFVHRRSVPGVHRIPVRKERGHPGQSICPIQQHRGIGLVVARVGRVTIGRVAVPRIGRGRSRVTIWRGDRVLILTAKAVEPPLLLPRSGSRLDIVGGGVVRKCVVTVGLGRSFVATPEGKALLGAVRVVVGGRRTETLLALVVTAKKELEEDGNEEEEAIKCQLRFFFYSAVEGYSHSNNGDGEDNLVQATGESVLHARWGIGVFLPSS